MKHTEKSYTFLCGAIGGAFEVKAPSISQANTIFREALNAHPDIYCDWVDLEGFDTAEKKCEDES